MGLRIGINETIGYVIKAAESGTIPAWAAF